MRGMDHSPHRRSRNVTPPGKGVHTDVGVCTHTRTSCKRSTGSHPSLSIRMDALGVRVSTKSIASKGVREEPLEAGKNSTLSATLYFLRNRGIVKLQFGSEAVGFPYPFQTGILVPRPSRSGSGASLVGVQRIMGTGACGICCDVCRLNLRGLCSSCGGGTEPAALRKLEVQERILHGTCPILKCAFDHRIAYCTRDCRRFPCKVFKQGLYPFSEGFLKMQERRRKQTRPPTVSIDQMAQWEQEEIDPAYWEELLKLDPNEVSRRTLTPYDPRSESYRVDMLNQGYTVHPFRKVIARDTEVPAPSCQYDRISFSEALVLILYLLRAREIPLAGRQVTEKDLPGGETFFRGPHALPREPILELFGRNPERFVHAGFSLGGKPLDFGDGAFRFQALPRVPCDFILWGEDEEFPARLTIVFDATVTEHLPLDVIWALVHLAARRIVAAASEER